MAQYLASTLCPAKYEFVIGGALGLTVRFTASKTNSTHPLSRPTLSVGIAKFTASQDVAIFCLLLLEKLERGGQFFIRGSHDRRVTFLKKLSVVYAYSVPFI